MRWGDLLQTFRVALRALLRNKLRSFLTMLGVIIGVAAVIAVVAIGAGAKARVEDTFTAMGTSQLIVTSGSTTQAGVRGGSGSRLTLTWDDLKAIRELPSIHQAVPMLRTTTSLVSDDQNWTTLVQGTTPDFFDIRNWPNSIGRSFTNSDVETQTKVVVLGRTVADKLFGVGSDPTSQIIRINNMPFEILGVLSIKGQTPSGQNHDDTAFVPASTFRTHLSRSLGNFLTGIIIVQATSPEMVAGAQAEISALLRDRHQILAGMDDDFSIRSLDETAKAQQSGAQTLSTLLSSIAAVSLLVGGIGIMNIMLVSVTERMREIGLRMAIGAKPQQIMAQFLIEALSLSMLGGAFGVMLGIGGALALALEFDWPLLIEPGIVLVAVSFSAVVGIGFGLYPAQKAARLDPIEALRYD